MEEKRKQVSELFAKYGLTKETLKLSQELDVLVANEQRERFEQWKMKIA